MKFHVYGTWSSKAFVKNLEIKLWLFMVLPRTGTFPKETKLVRLSVLSTTQDILGNFFWWEKEKKYARIFPNIIITELSSSKSNHGNR